MLEELEGEGCAVLGKQIKDTQMPMTIYFFQLGLRELLSCSPLMDTLPQKIFNFYRLCSDMGCASSECL